MASTPHPSRAKGTTAKFNSTKPRKSQPVSDEDLFLLSRQWLTDQIAKGAVGDETWVKGTPHPKQKLFLDAEHDPYLGDQKIIEVLFGGSVGGGKTWTLLAAALKYVHVPGYSALLLRKSFPDLAQEGGLMSLSKEWLMNTSAKWNEQQKIWTFPSGATLRFGFLDTESDKFKYLGGEYQFIGWDELTQHHESVYKFLFSRVRKRADIPVPLRVMGACVDRGEVLTKHGWVDIKEVKEGAEVYSLNTEGRLQLRKVLKFHEYDNDKKFLRFDGKGLTMSMTEDHRVTIRTRNSRNQKRAKYVTLPWNQYDAKTAAVVRCPESAEFGNGYVNPLGWDDEVFFSYLGLFIAEGCTSVNPKRHRTVVTQCNLEKRPAVLELLDRVPVKHCHCANGDFETTDLAAWNYFKVLGKSHEKHIPRDVLESATEGQLRKVFEWAVFGDGHVRNNGSIQYVTCSKQLADDISELGLRLGYKTKVSHKVLENDRHNDRYTVYLTVNSNTTVVDKRKIREVEYSGKIYCIEVEDNHNFVLRQEGSVWISGNTNPGNIGGKWVFERFIPNDFSPANARERDIWYKEHESVVPGDPPHITAFVPSMLDDNPSLDREAYLQSLMQLDEITRQQYLSGDWQIQTRGDILYTYSEAHTVISWSQFERIFGQRKIPTHWKTAVYLDAGTTEGHPNVTSWFATAANNSPTVDGVPLAGKVFLYRGHTTTQTSAREMAAIISDFMRHEKSQCVTWQMSHEASSERIEFNKQGLPFVPWKTGRTRGIEQLKNAFALTNTDKPNPFKPELRGCPQLFLVVDDRELVRAESDKGLARWREEILAYHWAQLKSGEPTTRLVPYALFNDAVDTMRAAAFDYWPYATEKSLNEKVLDKVEEIQPKNYLDSIEDPSYKAHIWSQRVILAEEARKKLQETDKLLADWVNIG